MAVRRAPPGRNQPCAPSRPAAPHRSPLQPRHDQDEPTVTAQLHYHRQAAALVHLARNLFDGVPEPRAGLFSSSPHHHSRQSTAEDAFNTVQTAACEPEAAAAVGYDYAEQNHDKNAGAVAGNIYIALDRAYEEVEPETDANALNLATAATLSASP